MHFFVFRISIWKDFHQNAQQRKQICYRTGKCAGCSRVLAHFSPEIWQAGAVKGLTHFPMFPSLYVLHLGGGAALVSHTWLTRSRQKLFRMHTCPVVPGGGWPAVSAQQQERKKIINSCNYTLFLLSGASYLEPTPRFCPPFYLCQLF